MTASNAAEATAETIGEAAGDLEQFSEDGFASFGLSEPVLRALAELGFEGPTPIQRATIEPLLAGRDVVAQAQTGTGKTAAFGIPLVERIEPEQARPQALILAPTRELAVQVAEALHQLGKYRRVRVLPVYGGQPMERQLRGLREGAHVVVGTPGRLLDHLRRRTLDLSAVRLAILDEADEMLNMGFLEDVESILAALTPEASKDEAKAGARARKGTKAGAEDGATGRTDDGPEAAAERRDVQVALFSATLPGPVQQLARRFQRNPVRIDIAPEHVTVPQIAQIAYEIGGQNKLEALARVLDVETPGSAIVFCATRRGVDEVADRLAARGYRVAALHGDMAQAERERVLRRFREGQVEVLIATDVAARGLDVEGVTHVINFDIPWDPGSYVHRIGRTGRAGRAGDAITLVTPRDYRLLRTIEQMVRSRIERKRLPSLADVATRRREATKEAVVRTLGAGDLDAYLTLAGELGDEHDPVEVAAAALRLWDLARTASGAGGGPPDGSTLAGMLDAAAEEARSEAERVGRQARQAEARRAAAEFGADGQAPEQGMARLFVAVGRWDGLRPQDLVGAIANEAGVRGRDVGAIDIYDHFSFVEVPAADAEHVVEALSRATIRGRRVGVRLADRNEEEGRRGPPRGEDGRRGPERGERRFPTGRGSARMRLARPGARPLRRSPGPRAEGWTNGGTGPGDRRARPSRPRAGERDAGAPFERRPPSRGVRRPGPRDSGARRRPD